MSKTYGIKIELDEELEAVIVNVREKVGEDFTIIDSGTFGLEGVNEALRVKVALYGLSKLLQDRSSSIPTGPDKLAAMNEVFAQFAEGTWEKERTRGVAMMSAEVEALAQMKGVSPAAIQLTLSKLTKEQKDKVYADPNVKAAADRIRAAREAAVEVDMSDLLAM